MKPMIAAVSTALLLATMLAPATAKGRRQQPSATSTEVAAKKKAIDEAYQAALKNIPDGKAQAKADPWGNIR